MPEYRQDPLTGRTVIVAEERAARPHQFDIEEIGSEDASSPNGYRRTCPFCEGNENQTPNEITAFRPVSQEGGTLPDTPGWTVRSLPNKYPAVVRDAAYNDSLAFPSHFSLNGGSSPQTCHDLAFPGLGHHEVIVDTPRHVLSVTDMTEQEVSDMFCMYRERLRTLKAEGRWACVEIFKNVGVAAGASIPHSHSQLIAMPFVPPAFQSMLLRARQYRERHHSCFWCDMLQFELGKQTRIVEETNDFVALCPFVSRFAAEVEIYPKAHVSGFETMENMGDIVLLTQFAALVRRTVTRLEQAVSWMKGPLAYNFVLQTQPFVVSSQDDENLFHWHLSILPSLARAAGFEWGTGLHINPVPPEKSRFSGSWGSSFFMIKIPLLVPRVINALSACTSCSEMQNFHGIFP